MEENESPDEALKEAEKKISPDESPKSETKDSEEVVEAEAEPTGEAKEETKKTGEGSKKGYSQRVRELNTRAKVAEEEAEKSKAKAESLEGRLAELTAPVEPKFEQKAIAQDEPIVAPGEEIDALELDKRLKAREQRILQQVEAKSELRSKQSEAVNRINNEAVKALTDFPELDPESEVFDKELSDSITEATEAHVKANPYSASVKTFVAKLMKPYKRAVDKEVGEVTEKIAKQASETALRPTSVKGGEKKFEELTEAEMEAKLGMVY